MENEHLESKNGGLEDEFPFQLGDVYVPALNSPGCKRFEGNLPVNQQLVGSGFCSFC